MSGLLKRMSSLVLGVTPPTQTEFQEIDGIRYETIREAHYIRPTTTDEMLDVTSKDGPFLVKQQACRLTPTMKIVEDEKGEPQEVIEENDTEVFRLIRIPIECGTTFNLGPWENIKACKSEYEGFKAGFVFRCLKGDCNCSLLVGPGYAYEVYGTIEEKFDLTTLAEGKLIKRDKWPHLMSCFYKRPVNPSKKEQKEPDDKVGYPHQLPQQTLRRSKSILPPGQVDDTTPTHQHQPPKKSTRTSKNSGNGTFLERSRGQNIRPK